MALTRKMLKAMGIEEEKIDQIIEAHTETVDALKKERDGLKEKADKYDTVKKELDDIKANPGEDWKDKHDKVKKEFDDFKADLTKKETLTSKKNAYSAFLESLGITDPIAKENAMLKADYDKMELDGDKIKDAEKMSDTLKTTYADYISEEYTKGSHVERPPKSKGAKMTKEEIMAIKDGGERRKAMAQNAELFGITKG